MLGGAVGLVVYLYIDSVDAERRVAYRTAFFVTLFGATGAFLGDAKFDRCLLGRFVGWFVGFVLGLFGRFGATLRVPIIVATSDEPNWALHVFIDAPNPKKSKSKQSKQQGLQILVAHAAAIVFTFFKSFEEGQHVEVDRQDNRRSWDAGRIVGRTGGSFSIKLYDNDLDEVADEAGNVKRVKPQRIRQMFRDPPRRGQRVEALHSDGNYYPAVVTAVLGGDTYSIVYDDGEAVSPVPLNHLEKPIEVGDSVRFNSPVERDGEEYDCGRVTSVSGYTYSIAFDDGTFHPSKSSIDAARIRSTDRDDEVFCVVPTTNSILNSGLHKGIKCKGVVDRAFTDPSAASVKRGWSSQNALSGSDFADTKARSLINEGFCKRDDLRKKVEKQVQDHVKLYEKERKARQPSLGRLRLLRWAEKLDY